MKAVKEKLTALCSSCKCCLANSSHCWICHNKMSIEAICGCDTCSARAKDYAEREAMRDKNRINLSKLGRY